MTPRQRVRDKVLLLCGISGIGLIFEFLLRPQKVLAIFVKKCGECKRMLEGRRNRFDPDYKNLRIFHGKKKKTFHRDGKLTCDRIKS